MPALRTNDYGYSVEVSAANGVYGVQNDHPLENQHEPLNVALTAARTHSMRSLMRKLLCDAAAVRAPGQLLLRNANSNAKREMVELLHARDGKNAAISKDAQTILMLAFEKKAPYYKKRCHAFTLLTGYSVNWWKKSTHVKAARL
jgi:hypothetical protein